MKYLIISMVLAFPLVTFAITVVAQEASQDASKLEAVGSVLSSLDQAVAARDAPKYAALFSEDADWADASGRRLRGRRLIEKAMAETFNAAEPVQWLSASTQIRLIKPDVAFADVYQEVAGKITPKGQLLPGRRARVSEIIEKRGDRWEITVHRAAILLTQQLTNLR